MKRFEVYKKIKGEWELAGRMETNDPDVAIATIKRYSINSRAKEWKAKELKLTKR